MTPNTRLLLLGLALFAVPLGASGQEPDRRTQLENRRAARLHYLESARPGWGEPGTARFMDDCAWGFGDPMGWGVDPSRAGYLRPGKGAPPYAIPDPCSGAFAPGGFPGRFAPLWPFLELPNPYEDWARIWGRGWLDATPVPPYHRFQYRFFPETLPDPARGGYVTPGEWTGGAVRPMDGRAAPAGACARVELTVAGADAPEVLLVPLPALGAGTPEALRAVLEDRLRRGAGVSVRELDGYVTRLPPADAIRSLEVGPCR